MQRSVCEKGYNKNDYLLGQDSQTLNMWHKETSAISKQVINKTISLDEDNGQLTSIKPLTIAEFSIYTFVFHSYFKCTFLLKTQRMSSICINNIMLNWPNCWKWKFYGLSFMSSLGKVQNWSQVAWSSFILGSDVTSYYLTANERRILEL